MFQRPFFSLDPSFFKRPSLAHLPKEVEVEEAQVPQTPQRADCCAPSNQCLHVLCKASPSNVGSRSRAPRLQPRTSQGSAHPPASEGTNGHSNARTGSTLGCFGGLGPYLCTCKLGPPGEQRWRFPKITHDKRFESPVES